MWCPPRKGSPRSPRRASATASCPELQVREALAEGRLVDLAPEQQEPVELFWHHWQIQSPLMARLAAALVAGAARALEAVA